MTQIKECITTLCVSFVGFGVISFLLPKGSIAKTAKVFFRFVLLFVFISTFAEMLNLGINIPQTSIAYESKEFNMDVNGMVLEQAKKNVVQELDKKLKEENIVDEDISVTMDILDNNYISISKVQISSLKQKEVASKKIENIVYGVAGVIPQIITKES